MASRTAFSALTPAYEHFTLPHQLASPSNGDSDDDGDDDIAELMEDELKAKDSRISHLLAKTKETILNNTGLLLVAASQAFFSLMNLAVKVLNGIDPPVTALQLIIVRMSITYLCSILYMYWAKIPDPILGPKDVRLLLLFRGFSGFFGLFGMYYSLQYISLSDATVLTFLSPMCTAVAGALFLNETFTRREALAGFCSLVGVILIARPVFLFGSVAQVPDIGTIGTGAGDLPMSPAEKGSPSERLVAVGVALLGVLGATGAYTSIRAVGKRAHPLHSLTFFSTLCVIISIPAMIVQHTPVVIPTEVNWLLLLLMIGIFGFVAQLLLTMGLQRETAGRSSMAIYSQIVFATILERIFFHTVPSALSVTGTLIIISAALYVALTKESENKQKPNAVSLSTISEESLEEGLLRRGQRGRSKEAKRLHAEVGVELKQEEDIEGRV